MPSPPLRVTILGLNYEPEVTGIAPYTAGLARGLSRHGHEVRVVTGYPHYPQWKVDPRYTGHSIDERLDQIEVRRVKQYTPNPPSNISRLLLEGTFGIRASTQNWHAPDVLVCVTPALISTAMAVARARAQTGTRPAIGIWVQDLYSRGLQETGTASPVTLRSARWFESATLRAADGIVVIHERFRRFLSEDLSVENTKIDMIRNWTHVQRGAVRSRAETRVLLNWDPDEIVVLHAGNIGAKQGLENVVEAASLANINRQRIRFVLLGDGNQRARLQLLAAANPRIQFILPMDDYNFRSALNASDILLVNELPGVTEMAVPSKLTTYFASGKPVLAATNQDSTTAQEIRDSGGGMRVPPGDPAELISAIVRLSADEPLKRELASRGLEYHSTALGEDAAIAQFDRWIRSLAERSCEGSERI